MRGSRARGVTALALLLAAVFASGCTAGGHATAADPGSYGAPASQMDLEKEKARLQGYVDQVQQAGQTEEKAPLLTEREDGKPLSAGTPFVGLDETLVDQTGLGSHDAEGAAIDGGALDGGVPYYWHAKNGTNDLLFSATVRSGRVVSVDRFNTGKDYWAVPGQVLGRDLPDVHASGAMVKGSGASVPDDPTDYASPDDYADNNEGSFTDDANGNAWQKAYDYWCDNHGAMD